MAPSTAHPGTPSAEGQPVPTPAPNGDLDRPRVPPRSSTAESPSPRVPSSNRTARGTSSRAIDGSVDDALEAELNAAHHVHRDHVLGP